VKRRITLLHLWITVDGQSSYSFAFPIDALNFEMAAEGSGNVEKD
jgi:hypothetical protein